MAEEEKKEKAEDTEAEEEKNEEAEGEGEEGEEGGKKKSKKKLIIIIVAALLIIGGTVGGLAFTGMLPGFGEEEEKEEIDPDKVAKINYYDMEEFLVNLNNPGNQVSFLKMRVTLELPNLATKTAVEEKLPRIRDSFQVYLRELRNSDLQGSAGTQRLKEELLLRINKMTEPEKVNEILIKEIIVQ